MVLFGPRLRNGPATLHQPSTVRATSLKDPLPIIAPPLDEPRARRNLRHMTMSAWLSGHALALAAADDSDARAHHARIASANESASPNAPSIADATIVRNIR